MVGPGIVLAGGPRTPSTEMPSAVQEIAVATVDCPSDLEHFGSRSI